ncbi:right-handed parallel beta-helix repeat-containing protein [Mucilaginibacter sabulilitoris]|uniref:Right-handed parallel beta-helix repeat-containing protein n=1 Tax=Mucilaginibacter sabulilitoris TaxID=1173583 RepID=A0ABZ0TRE3_9SPHI|nr:right-handed parallel beta-helix repeat-containing protein [Mucilaginibacter sabulilitoris]WPU95698.1 right-handed parallel beta-helix repeat-containing protein [Mucilaginibacter sabulilitoris]
MTRTLVINRTLAVPPGVDIEGGTLKNGTNMSGTLLTNNTFLKYEDGAKNRLTHVKFESSGDFQLSNWANAVVVLKNCRDITIEQCTFNLNQAYAPKGAEGVWITGENSSGNRILFNTLYTAGIEYAENGSSTGLIKGNLIINAHSNALSGHGNGKKNCNQNIITQNIITDAGFIGIEDWGNCYGSVISGNRITGTGKSPSQQHEGMGISAVGTNTIVKDNIVRDARLYYIESRGAGHMLITNNRIIDSQFKAIGIISNFTSPASDGDTTIGFSSIHHNSIQGTTEGIQVFGNFITKLLVDSNTLVNPRDRGIDIDSDAGNYQVEVLANKFIFDSSTGQSRLAILAFTRQKDLTGQRLLIKNNKFTYPQIALTPTPRETVWLIGTNNSTITGNAILSKDKSLRILSTTGASVTGLKISGNVLNGQVATIKSRN